MKQSQGVECSAGDAGSNAAITPRGAGGRQTGLGSARLSDHHAHT